MMWPSMRVRLPVRTEWSVESDRELYAAIQHQHKTPYVECLTAIRVFVIIDESDDRWEIGREYEGEDIHSSTVSGTSNLSFNCCILTTGIPLLSVLSSEYRFSSALPFALASISSLAWICIPSEHVSVDVVGVKYEDTGVTGCEAVKGVRGVVMLDNGDVDRDVSDADDSDGMVVMLLLALAPPFPFVLVLVLGVSGNLSSSPLIFLILIVKFPIFEVDRLISNPIGAISCLSGLPLTHFPCPNTGNGASSAIPYSPTGLDWWPCVWRLKREGVFHIGLVHFSVCAPTTPSFRLWPICRFP